MKGYIFYVTPGCLPPISILKDLVESAGGSMFLNKRPTMKNIRQLGSGGNASCAVNGGSTLPNNNNNNVAVSNNNIVIGNNSNAVNAPNSVSMNNNAVGAIANNNNNNSNAVNNNIGGKDDQLTTTPVANSGVNTTSLVNGSTAPVPTETPSKFICVTCDDDLYMCKELIDNGVRLYNVEVILTSILRQKVELDEYLLDSSL